MDLNPDQLPLVQGDEFLPSLSPWTTVGGLFLVSIFGTAVTLAGFLHYSVAVKVPATVRPAGELRLVQPAVGGTVAYINPEVTENQIVHQGEAIARLDDSRLQTQKSQLQGSIQQGQLQLGQIDAQLSNLDALVSAQSSLVDRTILSAQAGLEGNQRNYQDQQVTTQASVIEAEVALNLARMQQSRFQQGKELRATLIEAKTALNLAKLQRDRMGQIVKSGAISKQQFEEKQLAVSTAAARLEQAKAAFQNQFEEKELDVSIAAAKLKRARAADHPSNAAVTVASQRIYQEQARGKATLANLNNERQTLIQRRLELQNQLQGTQRELRQVETDLSQSVIRASTEGILLQLNLRNQGQVVRPGEAIAYIAPLNAPLLIKAQVEAQDIDKVKLGQKVEMQVSACPYPDYGTLEGLVRTVAPDALPAASKGADAAPPQRAYEVTVQPEGRFVGKGDRQCRLQAGMEGRADIISRQETVLQFILRKTRLLADL